MDSESDISTASDDGGGKKKEMKKSIFVKKKQNEGVDDNVKSSKSKNPLPTTHVKNQQIVKSVQKKRKADSNLNNIKTTNVVSLLYSCFRISKKSFHVSGQQTSACFLCIFLLILLRILHFKFK